MSDTDKFNLFHTIFDFILNSLRKEKEVGSISKENTKRLDWLEKNYTKLETEFLDRSLFINFGFYSMLQGCIMKDDFKLQKLDEKCINEMFEMQKEVFVEGYDENLLRWNTLENFEDVYKYKRHQILGVFSGQKLVAFGVLYVPKSCEFLTKDEFESLVDREDIQKPSYAVIKLIIVRKDWRGNGLQRLLISKLEKTYEDISLFLATVSPLNLFSINNFLKMSYKKYIDKSVYGGHERTIYYKVIK